MPVELLSAAYTSRLVGDVWQIDAMVLDADGDLTDVAPTVTITLPAGTTSSPTPERLAGGVYRAEYTLTVPGRHVAAVAAAGYGSAAAIASAQNPTYASQMPTVDDVDAYLLSGSGAHDWTTDDLAGALYAESANQARMCRWGPVYSADLREALLRRCQRNLALRSNALAMTRGDAESGDPAQPLPGTDPEVRRLERPYRKLPKG